MKRENNGKMRIIPLGGLEKIGMNITAFEYEDSARSAKKEAEK